MQSTPPWHSQEKSSWPTGVTSLSDAEKFAKLICGPHAKIENYASRLPHRTTKSFLLFIPGGCNEKPVSEIERCIEDLMSEVKCHEIDRGNAQNPNKGIEVKGGTGEKKTVYYHSAQLTAKDCTCRVGFWCRYPSRLHPKQFFAMERRKKIPAHCIDSVLETNCRRAYHNCAEAYNSHPAWLQKAWHAVMNFNDHRQNQGIDYHADNAHTYDF